MAYVLELEYGGTSVNLNDTAGVKHQGYFPQCGDDFTETGLVTENFNAIIRGADAATLQTKIAGINRAFLMARQYQERLAGDRVYVNHNPANYATEWRSEILDGKVDVLTHPKEVFDKNTVTVQITWTRRNWWEGPQADVPLTNGNDTDDTTGLKVYFCNDGTGAAGSIHHNYATIDGANDITGDLPGFGILHAVIPETITTLFTSVGRLDSIGGYPGTRYYWWEVTGSSDASYSNGDYKSEAISSGSAIISATVSAGTNGGATEGDPPEGPKRIIARVGLTAGAGTYRIVPAVATTYGTVERLNNVYITAADGNPHVYSLGVGSFGQYSGNVGGANSLTKFQVSAYAASGNLVLDFFSANPADSVADYKIANTSGNDSIVDDDSVADVTRVHYDDSGVPIYVSASKSGSNKILLYPGVDQILTMCVEPWTRDLYATITLKYRPRRSTL